jgi:type II secretory ATPase GspE/PulE/Tfp pilus assembly ATPase PilB-like protein
MRDLDAFLERALLEDGGLSTNDLERARRFQAEHQTDLVDAIIGIGAMSGREIALIRSTICEAPFVDLTDFEPCLTNTRLVPRSLSERFLLYPLFFIDGVVTLAMDDPLHLDALDQVRQILQCEVDAVLAERERIRTLIARSYSLGSSEDAEKTEVEIEIENDSAEASHPVVAAVNHLLADAMETSASDIHLNPDEHELRVRYRVDGVLQERQGPSLSMHAAIVQRIKVSARLDLTQTRRPQDGKFQFRHKGQTVEVRVSIVPTVCGENVVLRLLAGHHQVRDFDQLGIPPHVAVALGEILAHPYGMLLVTGPTGSGKTTTLYSALNRLNTPSRNVITIEDPVEIRLPYVRQIQVHPEIGLTFATAMRSILRQDPDIILLGEIRDNETAGIALQAALTGHFVLSTVHTNDAAGVVARLRDFSLPSFVINSALLGVLAQRLVRRVCPDCAAPAQPDELTLRRFNLREPTGFVSGRGCRRCNQSGYKGRVGLYELMRFTPAVQRAVEQQTDLSVVRDVAVREGMRLMWQDGIEKARIGLTTLEEVSRAASVIAVGETDETIQRKVA